MLRRGQTTTLQERLDITERVAAGQSDPQIAAALGCSVWTVRKWRRRGQHKGRTGLSSQMGRPATGPLGTLPTGMREAIVQMRRMHPGWGPTTLRTELQVDPRWADRPLPSRSRIAVLLSAEKLTRRYQKHSDLPTPAIQPRGAPHDEWELDAQGSMQVAGVGKVCVITVIDVVSRLKVESYPCLDTTNPPLEAYQLLLRRAFLTTGLPRRISLDHGTVFYDNTSPSPFPTSLHLWLLALGIEVCFIRKRCPTDHAKIERTHQTMTLQALLGQRWPGQTALWAAWMPGAPCSISIFPVASSRATLPYRSIQRLRIQVARIVPNGKRRCSNLLASLRTWRTAAGFGASEPTGGSVLGVMTTSLRTSLRNQMLELRFDAEQGCFVAQPADSETTITFAPQGLTKAELMGELGHLLALPAYQLALPFTYEAWRQLEYTHLLTGMTF
jgi:transposase InsO family protein/DNA-binding CsgD family transcriptional regulator